MKDKRGDIILIVNNEEFYGVIYKITNKINNKSYIGQTKVGFDKRYTNGKWWNATKNTELRIDVAYYGVENFEVTKVIDVAYSRDELNTKEEFWINYYDASNPHKGYNYGCGGARNIFNNETKEKIEKSREYRSKIIKNKKKIKELGLKKPKNK